MRNLIKKLTYVLCTVLCIYGLIVLINSIASRDIKRIRSVETEYISSMGMEIINYDGHSGSVVHGGFAWYKAKDKDGFLYEFALSEWDGEIMLYSMQCLNAVSK